MDLPDTNADWHGLNSFFTTFLNLIVRILVIHLYITFLHAMGLKSFKVEALGILGIKDIRVAFTYPRSLALEKQLLTAEIKSWPMILQLCLKK